MKIKLRTLKHEKYEIEIDPQEKVSRLKELIEERHQIEKSWQTLIFSGKQLDNEKTIESYNIDEAKDFLVLMVKKPAQGVAEKKSNTQPTATQPAPTPAQPTQSTEAKSTQPPLQPPPGVVIDAAALEKVCEMGFPKDQAEIALTAAFGNVDRAVEYLFNGIPGGFGRRSASSVPSQPPQSQSPNLPSQPQPAQPAQSPAQGQETTDVFEALRNHPQFPELCRLAQTGGEDALKQILSYFAQTHPQLIQTIVDHQAEFSQLLGQPVPSAQGGSSAVGTGALAGLGTGTPGVIRLQVTPEDELVINNFVAMGFDRNRVLEAYFLFEKDQALISEYLFQNLNDDEEMGDVGDAGDGGGLYGDDDDDDEEFDDGGNNEF